MDLGSKETLLNQRPKLGIQNLHKLSQDARLTINFTGQCLMERNSFLLFMKTQYSQPLTSQLSC